MDAYGHSTPPTGTAAANHSHVEVTNESWPPLEVSRRLGDKLLSEQIVVKVRVAFITGDEWLPGMASRWWRSHVRVNVNDARIQTGGVWVDAADVRRA